MRGLYLLHFEPRYRHAGHYLGYTTDVLRRVDEHLAANGKASPLVKATLAAGHTVELVRVWPGGDRKQERRIKDAHDLGRVCPVCRER